MRLLKWSFVILMSMPTFVGCGPSGGSAELADADADPAAMTAAEVEAWDSGEKAGAPPEGE